MALLTTSPSRTRFRVSADPIRTVLLAVTGVLLLGLAAPSSSEAYCIENATSRVVDIDVFFNETSILSTVLPPAPPPPASPPQVCCPYTNPACNPEAGQSRGSLLTTRIEPQGPGQFVCEVDMLADGRTVISEESRAHLGTQVPPNIVCTSYELDHSTIRQEVPHGNPVCSRDIQFFATADPQMFDQRLNEVPQRVTAIEPDQTLDYLNAQLANDPSIRGVLVAGDLTEAAHHTEIGLVRVEPGELEPAVVRRTRQPRLGGTDYHTDTESW